jgi:hypothetical protein
MPVSIRLRTPPSKRSRQTPSKHIIDIAVIAMAAVAAGGTMYFLWKSPE